MTEQQRTLGRLRQLVLMAPGWLKWLVLMALVIYSTLTGVFAIEEINAREGALKLLSTEQTEVLTRLAKDRDNTRLEEERAQLSDLQIRLTILTMDGAYSLGERGTLRIILCELDALHENRSDARKDECPDPRDTWAVKTHVPQGTWISSGAILAGLIVTAAFGGALIRQSLDDREDLGRTLLRALGGGIVCYFVVIGGGAPLSAIDIGKSSSPATASLLGLISGMFSNSVFRLVSNFVDAFVTKVTPASEKDAATAAIEATKTKTI